MSIAFTEYVNIISGVGGTSQVRQRDLITRIFTTNPLVPTGQQIEFTDIQSVGAYFGTTSDEYKRAQFYFSWISKNITSPQKISFANWANAATAPRIYGDNSISQALASYTSITSGSFTLKIGTFTFTLSGLDFSAAGSLTAVATVVQTAVRAQTGGGAQWTAATVVWNSVRGSFDFLGGTTGASTGSPIVVTAGAGASDVAGQLGWLSVSTILSNGSDLQTVTQVLTSAESVSNNFGSFLFMTTLSQGQVIEAANWTDAGNDRYMYLVPVTASNAGTISPLIVGLSGSGMTLTPLATEYPEMEPGMCLAATNYLARDSVQNYMYQEFPGLTPSVTDTLTSQQYNNLRVNYYGQTQNAGNLIQFYQRGVLTGASTDAVDMNVYANEMWLKDACGAAILSLLLSQGRVPANITGVSQILNTLQVAINAALFNGTISAGKILTSNQILFITNVTGSSTAWQQVQNIGYWKGCVIESYVTQDGRTEYRAVYTLIYSKDDAIRKVNGSHDLI